MGFNHMILDALQCYYVLANFVTALSHIWGDLVNVWSTF